MREGTERSLEELLDVSFGTRTGSAVEVCRSPFRP